MDPTSTYLTPQEVADVLRISRRTVYKMIRNGQIQTSYLSATGRGGFHRIHTDEVRRLLAVQRPDVAALKSGI